MKSIFQNRILVGAIVASHAALLAVRFTAADAFKLKPTDPTLEVILVNAKPLKPEGSGASQNSATLKIIERSAPFGRFLENMRSSGKDDVWELISTFEFTRAGSLEAKLMGGNNK